MRRWAASFCSILVLAGGLAASGAAPGGDNASIARWARGTFEYRLQETGEVWGSEWWHLTAHTDGTRTMQAINRMETSGTQRHVTLRVAEDFRPLEVTAVYHTGGEWRGTGLFSVSGNTLKAMLSTPNGIIRQTREVPDHFSFIPHPLSTNAWGTWYYDRAAGGPQEQTFYDMDSRAESAGSMLGTMYTESLEFMGTEEITTPAGTFSTERFRSTEDVDLYLTGPDAILVKFVWRTERGVAEFVLTSLETGT